MLRWTFTGVGDTAEFFRNGSYVLCDVACVGIKNLKITPLLLERDPNIAFELKGNMCTEISHSILDRLVDVGIDIIDHFEGTVLAKKSRLIRCSKILGKNIKCKFTVTISMTANSSNLFWIMNFENIICLQNAKSPPPFSVLVIVQNMDRSGEKGAIVTQPLWRNSESIRILRKLNTQALSALQTSYWVNLSACIRCLI